MTNATGLRIDGLSAGYGGFQVLRDLALETRGRLTVILGPNGAGKSTLLKAIAGLIPRSGRVRLGSCDAAVTVTDPTFGRGRFRGNAVLRWEYRPSSTLFVVWSQARDHEGDPAAPAIGTQHEALWAQPGTNIVTVKWTHWIGR